MSEESVMAFDVLSLDEIEEALANEKTRGEYKPVCQSFFDTGEVYLNLTERFPGRKLQSLKNAVKLRLKQDFASYDWKLATVNATDEYDGDLLLINMKAYAEARKAEAAAKAAAENAQ